jgi:hypothetical protein
MKFSTKPHIASIALGFILILLVTSCHAAPFLETAQPILLLFVQPAFSYFDLFTNAFRCHGIKSVITPTDCEYECAQACWVTHSSLLAPVADAFVFNLPEWVDRSNGTMVGPDPRLKGHQAWVLVHTESSQPDASRNYGQFLTSASFMQHFDVLVSWVRNSDVFMPPWELHMQMPLQMHLSDTYDVSGPESLMRRREDGVLAACWISNCIPSNSRNILLQELMQLVPTHSFGHCFNNARMPPEMDWTSSSYLNERYVLRKENWKVSNTLGFLC